MKFRVWQGIVILAAAGIMFAIASTGVHACVAGAGGCPGPNDYVPPVAFGSCDYSEPDSLDFARYILNHGLMDTAEFAEVCGFNRQWFWFLGALFVSALIGVVMPIVLVGIFRSRGKNSPNLAEGQPKGNKE